LFAPTETHFRLFMRFACRVEGDLFVTERNKRERIG
jgi:hypothetical protein